MSGKAEEASESESGREMAGDETVVRSFSVTVTSSGLWLHMMCQLHAEESWRY